MLDNFIYENHHGRKFIGLDNNVYLNYNELRDYSWNYDTINNRISRFHKGITEKKIPLTVYCNSTYEANEVKNLIHQIAEADIAAMQEGKVYIGDYYTKGYITASKKGDYLISKRLCRLELTLTSENPDWFKETQYAFFPLSEDDTENIEGIDYPYEYSYDYPKSHSGQRINCESINDNAFKLQIYGTVTNPKITIGNHDYVINGTLNEGEVLEIDSLAKTITLIDSTGIAVNWFDKRSRDSYIFEPIPSGINNIFWDGSFGFYLTVIEKRSEPKWT